MTSLPAISAAHGALNRADAADGDVSCDAQNPPSRESAGGFWNGARGGLEEENRQQHDNGDHDRGTDRPKFKKGLIRFLVRRIIHSFCGGVRQFAMIRHVKFPKVRLILCLSRR